MFSIIACISKKHRAIGYQNRLLYAIPSDMTRFRVLTTGHTIIMGRKTFESLPNGALPNRHNIVISKTREQIAGCEVFGSLEEALEARKEMAGRKEAAEEEEYFIIGGASIYEQALPFADKLYLTIVEKEPEHADTFFPEINPAEWEVTEKEMRNENGLPFTFLTLYRR
ncbi:MAG: dihydrofolate reductase [Segatella copri]|nr:dihydrofolate reductase [Segatella copri]